MSKILCFLCAFALPVMSDVMLWQIDLEPNIYIFANNIVDSYTQILDKKPDSVEFIENQLDNVSSSFYDEMCLEIGVKYLTYHIIMSSGMISPFLKSK